MSAYTLAIDYGTTYSVGVVTSDAGTEVLELNRSRYFPSLVLLDPDGELLVGNSAVNQAGLYPDRVCATPKRFVGRPAILMGGQTVEVHQAIGAVLARLASEAARRFDGTLPQRVILTHPALWASERVAVLRQAAKVAGLGEPELVQEPVAAAAHYADGALPDGANVAVYDLGGGTFDAAVLRRSAAGFDVAGRPGGDPNLGGEDFDNALRELVEDHAASIDPDGFETARSDDGARRQWSAFRREVREAKEALSDELKYPLAVPGIADPVLVTRRELEALLEPHLSRTIQQLAATIADAGLAPKDLSALYLTGGSSRIPLVSTLISSELGLHPQTWDDPKAVVALGAVQAIKPVAPVAKHRPQGAIVTCPSCGKRHRLPTSGSASARCAKCGTPLSVGAPGKGDRPSTSKADNTGQAETAKPTTSSPNRPTATTESAAGPPAEDGPAVFATRVLGIDVRGRSATIVCDAGRTDVQARVAHLLEATPYTVNHAVEFRHANAPHENLHLSRHTPATPWLRLARAQFEVVRLVRVVLLGDQGPALRDQGVTFGPHESYLQVFGLTPYADDRQAFEPFLRSFCAALAGDPAATAPHAGGAPSTPPTAAGHQAGSGGSVPQPAAQSMPQNGEVLLYQNRPWLRITERRFLLKGMLGGIKIDVPVEEILSFKGDGISAVRVVLRDGRTERWNCGVQNKEKMLKALERATGRRRG